MAGPDYCVAAGLDDCVMAGLDSCVIAGPDRCVMAGLGPAIHDFAATGAKKMIKPPFL